MKIVRKRLPKPTLVGKAVKFRIGTIDVVGVVKEVDGSRLTLVPTVPNNDGVLYVSKENTLTRNFDDVEVTSLLVKNCGVKAFETSDPLEGVKATTEVKVDGRIVDYVGVEFQGYGSTFKDTTPKDRDGDYILPTAFDKSLARFRENPVMLTDHTRSVNNLMGHYSKVGITSRGLALHGKVTDSPHPDAVHTRFQIVEKSLKTLSIGGMFYYLEDYRGIEEIELFETSLVVVPANPDASFSVLSLNDDLLVKAYKRHTLMHGGELRLAS